MVVNEKKFIYLFLSGLALLSVCIIGTCISSISMYNNLDTIQNHLLLIPHILSYVLIISGLLGLFGIKDFFIKIKRK